MNHVVYGWIERVICGILVVRDLGDEVPCEAYEWSGCHIVFSGDRLLCFFECIGEILPEIVPLSELLSVSF